jgi:hypothetical protein
MATRTTIFGVEIVLNQLFEEIGKREAPTSIQFPEGVFRDFGAPAAKSFDFRNYPFPRGQP